MFHVKTQREKLNRYKSLIGKYHATLDLVSDVALETIENHSKVSMKYSEAVSKFHREGAIVDIGSGVGLPGIVIAITQPEVKVILVERRARRVSFLQIVRSQLELDNLTIYREDIRNLSGLRASFITAQAVASFSVLYCLTRHIHRDSVILLSRKGEVWRDEIEQLEGVVDVQLTHVTRETAGIIVCEELHPHGTLLGVRVPGGKVCPPSVLSTKKAG